MEYKNIAWQMYEFDFVEKSADWYWALGIVAVAGAVASTYLNNLLFAIIILLAAFAVGMHGNAEPRIMVYRIDRRGLYIDKHLYHFEAVESFWIEEFEHRSSRVLVKSKKIFMPYIVMPLSPDIDPEEIRHFLLDHGIAEIEHHEPIIQQIFEYLGF